MTKRRLASKDNNGIEIEPLALPEAEIRRLVTLTTTRYKIEPFIKQLIKLMGELKAGQTHNIAKLARPGRDESGKVLFQAIIQTVNEGNGITAYHTAFQAGLYAYENSLDHLLAFMDYLDRLRQSKPSISSQAPSGATARLQNRSGKTQAARDKARSISAGRSRNMM